MSHTVAQIAQAIGGTLHGDGDLRVSGLAEPAMAGPYDLALALSPAYGDGLRQGSARAAVIWPGADWRALGLSAVIEAPRARLAMSTATQMLAPDDLFTPGIHPSAIIAPSARIGNNVSIGPLTVVEANAHIGDGSRLAAQVWVGQGVQIGTACHIAPGVRLMPRVQLGARVRVQSGAVIGSDGFSYTTTVPNHAETTKGTRGDQTLQPPTDAKWHRIDSLGAVVLADDVEIGANSTIDAGTIRPTRIGRGTKLDNLVHIGHNVEIGEDCLLCGQVGIAGSSVLGDRVILAGQCGVGDHHKIGNDVLCGGATKVMSNVASGRIMLGYPAQRMDRVFSGHKALRRLVRKATTTSAG